MASLSEKLSAALASRERRLIRRRLPDPPSDTLKEIGFTSNDYLSLSTSPMLRKSVLSALAASPKILGSGGSRLLVPAQPHVELHRVDLFRLTSHIVPRTMVQRACLALLLAQRLLSPTL